VSDRDLELGTETEVGTGVGTETGVGTGTPQGRATRPALRLLPRPDSAAPPPAFAIVERALGNLERILAERVDLLYRLEALAATGSGHRGHGGEGESGARLVADAERLAQEAERLLAELEREVPPAHGHGHGHGHGQPSRHDAA
jgi:hypothetical protein